MKIIIIVILSVIVLYAIMINWRPFTDVPLFSFDCCTWTVGKEKPK